VGFVFFVVRDQRGPVDFFKSSFVLAVAEAVFALS